MLAHVRLVDFKGFVDEAVDLGPLTLVVGANAAGKSNLFDALRFLSKLPTMPLGDILDGKGDGSDWPGIRGGFAEVARFGCSAFELESCWHAAHNGGPRAAWHAIRCSSDGVQAAGIEKERIGAAPGDEIEEHLAAGALDPVMGGLSCLYAAALPQAEPFAALLRDAFGKVQLLDPRPERMRGYGRRGQPFGRHGHNLSGILADLCADPSEHQGVVDWLVELCAPEVQDLDFITVPDLGDVIAVAVERGGKRISVRSLSDGTLRFLGLLVALRTAPPGSCLLIEDLDMGLHPTRIRLLVEYLEAVTRDRQVQVVATTHSPAVLQWLGSGALNDVVLCAIVPEREGTRLRRLRDLPAFEQIVERKGIDALFSSGWLELAV